MLVDSVAPALRALTRGLHEAIPAGALRAFAPAELRALVSGDARAEDWSAATIGVHMLAKHGFDAGSEHVQWLVRVMSTFDEASRRNFLL